MKLVYRIQGKLLSNIVTRVITIKSTVTAKPFYTHLLLNAILGYEMFKKY